jgi:hypothetical protein
MALQRGSFPDAKDMQVQTDGYFFLVPRVVRLPQTFQPSLKNSISEK